MERPLPKRAQNRPTRKARSRRPRRSALALRWLALAALVLVGVLYYRPVRAYMNTKRTLSQRTAEVRALRARKHQLERRVATAATDAALVREARRLGLVKPGERLFIVKGLEAWGRARSTIGGDE
jgi:cell division protein FtsB